ncbi:hypothetical protein E1263_41595 [Kribbella antibiotica]|uniref:Uncharacterized protein n=1 Tax=Kribbella antibiotica TaxID=190195 RepID=A0A4V2YKT9_9ACTN|nr:hypothetical protein [Kribbella antibiotica]TDD43527.1 hypothetical protein E1263_41595 [Kribbella antibiotica]
MSAERTFATTSTAAQSLISIGVPFIGAVAGARRERSLYKLALGYALGMATLGLIASLLVAALVPSTAADPWKHAPAIIIGAFITQVVAQSLGTGFGLLIGRPVIASILTIVPPLAVYFLLAAVAPGAKGLAPYGSAQLWWKGEFSGSDVLLFVVMVAVWGVGLNLWGTSAARSRQA